MTFTDHPVRTKSFSADAGRRRMAPTRAVPHTARGPEVPPEGYVTEEIADGVFWLGDGALDLNSMGSSGIAP